MRWIIAVVALSAVVAHGAEESTDVLRLKAGDVLRGVVLERTEAYVILEHPLLGRLTIPKEHLMVEDEGQPQVDAEAPADSAVAAVDAAAPADDEADQPAAEWSSRVDVGLNATFGNSDDQSLAVDVGTERQSPRSALTLASGYYYAVSDNETTNNQFNFTGNHDWLNPESRWFYFVRGTYDFDEFESWRHRVAGQGGPGYHLVQADDLTIDLKAGLGARREFVSENDDVKFEAVGQVLGEWQMTDRQSLTFSAAIFPVVTEPDDYRTEEQVAWRMALDNDQKLNLAFKIKHEYQSVVDPENDKHDVRLFLGLGYQF